MSGLALFDLDNTLLTGDSEVLWADFLVQRGLLDAEFAERNAEMDRRYHAGLAAPSEFCEFFASTFAGKSPAEWAPVRESFMEEVIRPRIPAAAHARVQQHREHGDLLVLTSATSRFLVELTAVELGFKHVIATELQVLPDGPFPGASAGHFTGRTRDVLNMREGKLTRLDAWLTARGDDAEARRAGAFFYSDSINDLPLLLAIGQPVVVDPDARLAAEAQARHWPVLRLDRTVATPSYSPS
ncbi:HAD family hydrolase [soil metagenome]